MNRNNKKLIIIISCLQMGIGIITALIGVLYLLGKLGENVGVCVIPVFLCCILACINMFLMVRRVKTNKD